jgi:predicted GIY-YIG superfamily endonuclease
VQAPYLTRACAESWFVLYTSEAVSFEVLRSPKGEAGRSRTTTMHYVYIIQSQKDRSYYVGSTKDLKIRLQEHNRGDVRYTSSKTPHKLVWYCAFVSKKKALDFEKYLKQGSGFAFVRKRLV